MEELNNEDYEAILKDGLITAMGCTEPIAIAYASSYTRKILENIPKKINLIISNNIIKNAKSAVIPNTNGLKGIKAAAAAGIIAGNPEKKLEVLSDIKSTDIEKIEDYLSRAEINIQPAHGKEKLDIIVKAFSQGNTSTIRIAHNHTKIIYVEKNGVILKNENLECQNILNSIDNKKKSLSIDGILHYAEHANIDKIIPILKHQIKCNSSIAKEGINNPWGAQIGKTILANYPSIEGKAMAYAAAGSDARMSGCEMPVVINSGSGNQGITVTLPVCIFAKENNISINRTYRALIVSNLISIHIKNGIGALSAFCGAVSAGCGAVCGVAWLLGKSHNTIKAMISNTLATTSGIFCDGAKPSCAAKIAISINASFLSLSMAENNLEYKNGEGIIGNDVEQTISHIAQIASNGMNATDNEIINIMCN